MKTNVETQEPRRIARQPRPSIRLQAPDGQRTRWAHALVPAGMMLAILKGFQGGGNYCSWFELAVALPCVTALALPAYRRRLYDVTRILWGRLEGFRATRGQLPWASALTFAVIPAALLNLSNGQTAGAGDTCPAMLTAISLVTVGDCNLDEFCRDGPVRRKIEETGRLPLFLQRQGGHIYSSYPAGMVAFALPVAALSRVVGGDFDHPMVAIRLEKVAAALVGAIGVGLFFLLALHLAPPTPALATTAVLAAGSAMFSTIGQGLWQHGGIIVWSLVVLLVEFRGEGRRSRGGTLLQGLACGMMPACRLTAAVFLLPFGLWVFARSPRRALAIAGVAALSCLPWALGYWAIYGSPFGPSTNQMVGNAWTASIRWPLVGVLTSPGRGMLLYQPWVVLAPLAFVPAVRRAAARRGCDGGPAGWPWFCGAAILFHVGLVSAWTVWWGGWCWGSRLVSDVLPLCALLALRPITVLSRLDSGRRLVLTLAIAGLLMQIPSVYLGSGVWNRLADVDQHPDALWSWSRAPFLLPITGAGPS